MNDPRVCLSWATRGLPLMGHTGVCHNFPRGAHVFCLSKDPHGTRMKPMCVCRLYCPCWANVWLPLWGHTWTATHGAHWSMQQFSTCYPWVLPLKGPTWDPYETHVFVICIAHVGQMCDYHCGATHWLPCTNGAHWNKQQFSTWYPCVLPLKGPTWDPQETHVYLPSVLPMLGQYVTTVMGPHVGCHQWGTLEYATIFHVGPMCFASQSTHMGPT